ncbi:hypothetical protein PTKIN_Ptkin08bG0037200 [Pterospermum kingtungense]
MSLFVPFCRATELMQPEFERRLQSLHPTVSFMVSDGFLWWTSFGFPRLVFYGMGLHAHSITKAVAEDRLLLGPESDNELITVTQFPWIKVTKNDFDPAFSNPDADADADRPLMKLGKDQTMATSNSYGYVVNSFYEMEKTFIDCWNSEERPKAWCVGPLCLSEPAKFEHEHEPQKKQFWIKWLDEKLDQGSSVLYVAFGSQAEVSSEQHKEIAMGLEESKVNFLWVIRKKESELGEGFEERVKERGIVVREWVDQRQILMHRCVKWLLSHCGWNSVLESICAGVPILAWPMLAEQPLNARMVVEELKAGIRLQTCDGKVRWFCEMGRGNEDGDGVDGRRDGERGKEKDERTRKVEKDGYGGE